MSENEIGDTSKISITLSIEDERMDSAVEGKHELRAFELDIMSLDPATFLEAQARMLIFDVVEEYLEEIEDTTND